MDCLLSEGEVLVYLVYRVFLVVPFRLDWAVADYTNSQEP